MPQGVAPMMTPSHLLVTGLVAHRLRRGGVRVAVAATLVGSVAPDLPLALLTLWFLARARPAGGEWFGELYDAYFFHEPVWIISHNILHAPLILGVLFLVGALLVARQRRVGDAVRWFAAGAAGHTLVDVFTHRHDGPLLLFPLEWSFRIQAPVSYWDPNYGGDVFFRFELAADLLIVGYFLFVLWGRRRAPAG